MRGLHNIVRLMRRAAFAALLSLAGAVAVAAATRVVPVPSTGDTIPDPSAWQYVITGQIEAFRRGDARAAMGYAGSMFKRRFHDPTVFMMSIAAAGYAPIFTSTSHSFGKFVQPDPKTAVQVVEFIGAKQELYEAIYAVSKEAEGWRVEGVQLMKLDGIAA